MAFKKVSVRKKASGKKKVFSRRKVVARKPARRIKKQTTRYKKRIPNPSRYVAYILDDSNKKLYYAGTGQDARYLERPYPDFTDKISEAALFRNIETAMVTTLSHLQAYYNTKQMAEIGIVRAKRSDEKKK